MNDRNSSADKAQEESMEDYARAGFQNLEADATSTANLGANGLDMILDIPVTVAVEIGRTTISISNLLKLNPGSVVELDRFAGEPMDITVNGTLVARGEVVVVNEKFGIRLTDVVSAAERVRKLK
ncbi:MAG: flagellar motor switch protein FliN [Chromatiales bacterium]|jgi:flagellar motor switch protein FliN/FliY|nr:flagellar motor switch protein FliN [Chromatiales bacterium]